MADNYLAAEWGAISEAGAEGAFARACGEDGCVVFGAEAVGEDAPATRVDVGGEFGECPFPNVLGLVARIAIAASFAMAFGCAEDDASVWGGVSRHECEGVVGVDEVFENVGTDYDVEVLIEVEICGFEIYFVESCFATKGASGVERGALIDACGVCAGDDEMLVELDADATADVEDLDSGVGGC